VSSLSTSNSDQATLVEDVPRAMKTPRRARSGASRDLRRFLRKFVLFALSAFIFLNLGALLIPPSGPNLVWQVLARTHQPCQKHILILGDSAGQQMFHGDHETADSLHFTTNLGVSMAGHYIIAARMLESGTPVQRIYLLCIPPSFQNELNQHFTFNAFVKPFYNRENKKYFTPLLYQRLSRQPYWLTLLPITRSTWFTDSIDYGAGVTTPTRLEFSPLSIEYLQKLRDLCQQKHVELHVIAPPINSEQAADYSFMRQQVRQAGLEQMFDRYFEDMEIADAKYFRDEHHLREEFIPQFAQKRWKMASLTSNIAPAAH
jgi:hypothetical protein